MNLGFIAAEKGLPTAQHNLGACLAHPDATNQDFEMAAYWFHRGAESGLRLSMLSLAHIYENGEGVNQDPAIADYWRDRASKTIDPEIDGGIQSVN